MYRASSVGVGSGSDVDMFYRSGKYISTTGAVVHILPLETVWALQYICVLNTHNIMIDSDPVLS